MIKIEVESVNKDTEALLIYVEGIFGKGESSLNGRIYPKDMIERELQKIKKLMLDKTYPIKLRINYRDGYEGKGTV